MGKKLYATIHYMEGIFIDLNSDSVDLKDLIAGNPV